MLIRTHKFSSAALFSLLVLGLAPPSYGAGVTVVNSPVLVAPTSVQDSNTKATPKENLPNGKTPAVVSPEQVSSARVHFLRGVESYKEGAFDIAVVEFTRAYEIAPNFRVLYNIAQSQAERHDYAAALSQYDA
jgi:hypothetical protein